jgi:hypothetical protein
MSKKKGVDDNITQSPEVNDTQPSFPGMIIFMSANHNKNLWSWGL